VANAVSAVEEATASPSRPIRPKVRRYRVQLGDSGGRLYLSGLEPGLIEQLRHTGQLKGPVRSFEATPVVGESTQAAYLDAEAWLAKKRG
jgi:sulfate permease, SulP family